MSQLFAKPDQPFHIDIGCAKGSFCIELARKNPEINILGLEIRKPIAAYCSEKAKESGLPNIGFLCCNANVDLERILNGINLNSRVSRCSIQYPDPQFKVKHQKRRVVQPELIETIAANTGLDAEVFLQSDVIEVAIEMRERFRANKSFRDTRDGIEDWIEVNPLEVATEREIATAAKGLPVYRALFKKRESHLI